VSVGDTLLLLDVLFEVRVALAPDGEHLAVSGSSDAIALATPKLLQLKPEILEHLRANRAHTSISRS
jgi:hypothetical protein